MNSNLAQIFKPDIEIGIKNASAIAERLWDIIMNENDSEPTIFSTPHGLVRVVCESSFDGDTALARRRTVLQRLDAETLAFELAQRVDFIESRGTRLPVEKFPPMEVVRHMLADPNPPIRRLISLRHAPYFTAEGRLVGQPGLDDAYGILYRPAPGTDMGNFTVSSVTPRRLKEAVSLISDQLLGDFPFVAPSYRAHAIALMILPFVRQLIEGPTPFHLCDKTKPGEGATLLVEALLFPAFGVWVPRTTPPADEGELRRTLFSILDSGFDAVFLDNLKTLKGSSFASAITSSSLVDRRVGSPSAREVPARCVWVGTGIEVEVSEEIARRTLPIKLDSGLEAPATRTGFKIPFLRDWVHRNRRQLVEAVLVIVQGWIEARRPESAIAFGGFERYAAVVGGILENAGICGFLSERVAAGGTPEFGSAASIGAFCALANAEYQGRKVEAKELLDIARRTKLIGPNGTAPELGRLLGGRVGREFGGFKLERGGMFHKTQLWKVVRA